MSIFPFVLLAALAAAPAAEEDPTVLVAKLGSAEPAERAAATDSLRALGRAALPALQEAMKGGDADHGKRASATTRNESFMRVKALVVCVVLAA
jgi:hypothetical protein